MLSQVLWQKAPEFRKAARFGLISSLLMLVPQVFMLEVYGRVINSGNLSTLNMLLLCTLGAYLMMAVIDYARLRVTQLVGWQLDATLRDDVLAAMFGDALRKGDVSQAALQDLRVVREFLGSSAVSAVLELPASLLFLILVTLINPWLGAIALVGAVVQMLIGVGTERQMAPLLERANLASNAAQSYATGVLHQTRAVLAMGMLDDIHRRWIVLQRRFLRLQADASDTAGSNAASSKLIQTLQSSLILGGSCLLAVTGVMSMGGGLMIVASTLGGRVLVPLMQLVSQWRQIVNARQSYRRLDALLSDAAARKPPMQLPAPSGQLAAESMSVAAPGGVAIVLRNVSFSLAAGETLAIIGPSGAGKTCLARVLAGAWPATAGKLRLDGADINQWEKEDLGRHIGYLPQAVELLAGSLADNIARFTTPDPATLHAACALAGLEPLIAGLPSGLDSPIGDEGCFLSGGQRQRVGLARAIYGMPRLVVLDEPSASLDDAGEKALMTALQALRDSGATVAFVTHRTNLLAAADKIMVMNDGQVVAFGPRDDVLAAMRQSRPAQSGTPRPGLARADA